MLRVLPVKTESRSRSDTDPRNLRIFRTQQNTSLDRECNKEKDVSNQAARSVISGYANLLVYAPFSHTTNLQYHHPYIRFQSSNTVPSSYHKTVELAAQSRPNFAARAIHWFEMQGMYAQLSQIAPIIWPPSIWGALD